MKHFRCWNLRATAGPLLLAPRVRKTPCRLPSPDGVVQAEMVQEEGWRGNEGRGWGLKALQSSSVGRSTGQDHQRGRATAGWYRDPPEASGGSRRCGVALAS